MRVKKWLTYITGIITLVSFIAIIIIEAEQAQKKAYDIFLAIFGSGLLGMIMSLIEYFTERRKAMEEFWTESKKVLDKLKDMQPVVMEDEPKELMMNCIEEKFNNDACDKFRYNIAKMLDMKKSTEYLVEYESWLEEHQNMPFTENDDRETIIREVANSRIEGTIKHLDEKINEYITISKIDLQSLDNAYGNLDFLLPFSNLFI